MSFFSYMSVFRPLLLRKFKEKKAVPISILFIWIITFSVSVPLIISHNLNFKLKYDMDRREITGGGYLCDNTYSLDWGINSKIYLTLLFVIFYILPLIINCVLYTKALHQLWITKPIDILPKFAPKTGRNFEQKKRDVLISVAISSIYYVLYFPVLVMNIYNIFNPSVELNRILVHVLNMFGFTTGIIGPIIYILLHKAAQERLVTIVTCTCCNEDDEHVLMSNSRPPMSSRLSTLTATAVRDNRRRSSVMWQTQ